MRRVARAGVSSAMMAHYAPLFVSRSAVVCQRANVAPTMLAEPFSSTLVVGLPLLLIVGFLKLARFPPPASDPDPNAIDLGGPLSIQSKIFSARATAAPGFMLVEEDTLDDLKDKAPDDGEDGVSGGDLAGEEDLAARAEWRRAELQAALDDAVAREDYKTAAQLKEQLEDYSR